VTQAFQSTPESQTVIEGSSVSVFSCKSTGVPQPVIHWRFTSALTGVKIRFDRLISKTHPRISVEANNDLVIRDVKNVDEGKYTCVSVSPVRYRKVVANATATLTVHGKFEE